VKRTEQNEDEDPSLSNLMGNEPRDSWGLTDRIATVRIATVKHIGGFSYYYFH